MNDTDLIATSGQPLRMLALKVVKGPDQGKLVEGADSLTVGTAETSLQLTDRAVSRFHAEFSIAGDRIRVRDLGSRNGTYFRDAQVSEALLLPGSLCDVGRSQIQLSHGAMAQAATAESSTMGPLRGRSLVMRRLMARIDHIAPAPVPVTIEGESGTGKELIAQLLHERSPRANLPFVTVDCGALSPSLVASEFFGHEKGAFTGAERRRIGAFEQASGGTLFLDEVGELPEALQASLLGVLERRQFRRVGGAEEVSSNVRVIAATNRDLRADVNAGRFRLDLYYRITGARIVSPPLREHLDDLELYIEHFCEELGRVVPPRLRDRNLLDQLRTHRWPGNVRELRNFVEATVTIGEAELDFSETPSMVVESAANAIPLQYKQARQQALDGFERAFLNALFERAPGRLSNAARVGGIDRSQLASLARRHGFRSRWG